MTPNLRNWLLGLIGAIGGGVVGYLAFGWISDQGFYAGALPGALIGIGCGLLVRNESVVRGVLCGVAGVAWGFFCEWSQFPFAKDESLGFFLGHLHKLSSITLLLIGLGGFLSYWFGRGQMPIYEPRPKEPTETSPDR